MTCICHRNTCRIVSLPWKYSVLGLFISPSPITPGNQTPFSFWTFLNLAAADSNLTKQRGQQMCVSSSEVQKPSRVVAKLGMEPPMKALLWAPGCRLLGTFAVLLRSPPPSHICHHDLILPTVRPPSQTRGRRNIIAADSVLGFGCSFFSQDPPGCSDRVAASQPQESWNLASNQVCLGPGCCVSPAQAGSERGKTELSSLAQGRALQTWVLTSSFLENSWVNLTFLRWQKYAVFPLFQKHGFLCSPSSRVSLASRVPFQLCSDRAYPSPSVIEFFAGLHGCPE